MQAHLRRAAAALCVALLATTVVQRSSQPTRANHDVAWHVHAGGVLLDGGVWGVDVVDNNPPLVYWLASLVVALARLAGVSPLVAYAGVAFALALASSLLVRRLLRAPLGSPALADALGLAILALLTLLPGFDFAQRDPILAACLLPYLVAAGSAAGGAPVGRGLGLTAGALAGFGISLKPHYTLLWLGVEAWLLLRTRRRDAWRRPENAALASLGAAYVGSVLVFTPAYLDAARQAWNLYGTYGTPVPLLGPSTGAALLAAVAAALLRSPAPLARVAEALAVGSGLALLALFLQDKDFSYHHEPVRLLAAAALAVAAAGALARLPQSRERLRRAAAWSATLVALAGAAFVSVELQRPALRRAGIVELAALIEREADGGPVLVFSSSVDPLFPALTFTGAGSASPYSCLWLIAGHYDKAARRGPRFPYRRLAEMGAEERRFVEGFVDTLEARRPTLLLFETTPVKQSFGPTAFDFERYFRADPRFARWLSGYRRTGRQQLLVDGLRSFDVWERR